MSDRSSYLVLSLCNSFSNPQTKSTLQIYLKLLLHSGARIFERVGGVFQKNLLVNAKI